MGQSHSRTGFIHWAYGVAACYAAHFLALQFFLIQHRHFNNKQNQPQSGQALNSGWFCSTVLLAYAAVVNLQNSSLTNTQNNDCLNPTDFAVSGQEITAVRVNDKPELTNKEQAGRYVILQVQQVRPLTAIGGTTIWASDSEQGKHECIILAPQYTADLVDKIGMMTTDENVWVTLSQHQPWQLWGICMKTGWV